MTSTSRATTRSMPESSCALEGRSSRRGPTPRSPWPAITAWAMTASRSVLLGIVPVSRHTPPTQRRFSTTAARWPSLAACTAARCPAGPLPIATRSKSYTARLSQRSSSPSCRPELPSKRSALNGWATNVGRSVLASNANTKNWFGLSTTTPFLSRVAAVKSLSFTIHSVCLTSPLRTTSGPKAIPLDLRRDVDVGEHVVRRQRGHDVEKERLCHHVRREIRLAGDLADVGGALQVDLEQMLDLGCAGGAVAQALAVALVHQKLVIVDREDLAHTGAGRQPVGVLACLAGADVDGDDPDDLATVLDQRVPQDADKRPAARRDRETFHPFVGDTAQRVAGDLVVADRAEMTDRELFGEREGAGAPSAAPIELVDVRTVFVGDVNAAAVIGHADAFRIQSAIEWIRRDAGRVEVVRAAREVVHV